MKRAGFFLVFAALVLAGCASTGRESGLNVNQLQQIGEKFLLSGDTGNALRYLTEAEQKKPGSAAIKYDLGIAYNQRGMTTEAIAHLRKALEIKPAYPEAMNAIGTIYAESGQLELAREMFEKALADPFYQTPHLAAYNLGSLYEKKGDTERALREYEKALKIQPGYGSAWYRKGKLLETLRRGDEARDAYGKAIAAAPDLAEAHLRYGIMSYQAADMEAAIFSLNRVVKLAPNSTMASEARIYLGRLRGITKTSHSWARSQDVSPAEIDIISRSELERNQVKAPEAQPSGKPRLGSPDSLMVSPGEPKTAEPGRFVASPIESDAITQGSSPTPKSPEAPATAPEPGAPVRSTPVVPESTNSSSAATQFHYIVQLGSFVDKAKAEEMREVLREKGYIPVVKLLNHDVMGRVYVIQLKPEPSFSKATTIVTQIGKDIPGEAVILKVPVEKR